MTLRALAFAACLAIFRPLNADPAALDTYAQELLLEFPDEAQAARATVEVAPLYRDSKWAFTQRWDDNRVDSMRVRDLLARYRMRGTFYLNSSNAFYSNESSYPYVGEPSKDLARSLVKGGNSIGGHTMTHDFVPALNWQEVFWQMLGVRVDRELSSQSPVISFVFPFNAFQNDLEGKASRSDMAQSLLRGGYYHLADQYFDLEGETGLLNSWLLPCDGEPSEAVALKLLQSDKQRDHDPSLCVCMHAWPSRWGGDSLPELKKVLARWQGRKTWWYANQNEYASYRYQRQHGALVASREGKKLHVRITRFEPWDLGDAVPLTLRLRGSQGLSVTVESVGGPLKLGPSLLTKGVQLIDVPHDPGHALPAAYSRHQNLPGKENGNDRPSTPALAGLFSRLSFSENNLELHLKNSEAPLEHLRVRFRVPLGWEAPPDLRLMKLAKGQEQRFKFWLTPTASAEQRQGQPYLAAQLDFMRAGQRLRLYSDCRAVAPERDASLPKGGFIVLGPLPGDREDFALEVFASRILRQAKPAPCHKVFGDVQACWQPVPEERVAPLHPEIVPAGGLASPPTFYTWNPGIYYPHGHKLHYLLATRVYSPSSRTAKALLPRRSMRRVYVNGLRVTTRQFELKQGENLLTFLYRPGTHDKEGQGGFHMKNYGPFFRLVDEKGDRMKDIRFEAPAWGQR